MPIRTRRSIADIYEAVREYDLVLTADAPLSLALNRRVETPRLGRFAATPRMLASGDFAPSDRRPLFQEVIDRTDLTWKQSAYLVDQVLDAWEETGSPERILTYEEFDNPATKAVLEVVQSTESSYRAVTGYSISSDRDVIVVGEDQFTALDRRILPETYDTLDPFEDGALTVPTFHLYDSATAIVDAVVEAIAEATDGSNRPERAEQVGIVLHEGGEYRPLVESALESAGIPYYGGPGFADDIDLRTLLGLLRLARSSGDVRVRDVRGLLSQLGEQPPVSEDRKRLSVLAGSAAGSSNEAPSFVRTLQVVLEELDGATFREAIDCYEAHCGADLHPLRRELDRLGLAGRRVTAERLDDLEFYLDAFDVPVDRDDEGVLLASATSSVYVDRPTVFYLGLSTDWTRSIPDRPWIDAAATDAVNLREFQLRLQNGQERYYLVRNAAAGEPITPCLYFHDLLADEFPDIEEFRDLPHESHGGRTPAWDRSTGFEHRPVGEGFDSKPDTTPSAGIVPDTPPSPVETMSQSTLATLANCPRDHFFDRLLDRPETDYFTRGTVIHDFAEFAVAHPDVVERTAWDKLVSVAVDALRPFTPDREVPLVRTRLRAGLRNVWTYLTESPPAGVAFDAYDPFRTENVYAEHFDRPIGDGTDTEQWFEDRELGAKGVVDLLPSSTTLVDYKTGSRKSAGRVVANGDLTRDDSGDSDALVATSDTRDFQVPLYLAHHRRVVPSEPLTFRLVHVLETVDDVVTGDATVEDMLTEVRYHPLPFADFVATRTAFDLLTADVSESNDRRKTLEALGYEAYHEFFDTWDVPDDVDRDEILETPLAEAFEARATAAIGEYTYVTEGTRSALRKLVGIRGERLFADDLDRFERYLDSRLSDLNAYRGSRFPVGEDPNWDRVDHRDLILSGDVS
ncbi:MAG: PD-(D/E)XK nuclease family protein [Halodesulfurarchaeum sp.]